MKKNRQKLLAVAATALFHALIILVLYLESKQPFAEEEKITPEMLLQLENLETFINEPMPQVLADNKGEKEVSTNQKAEPPKLEELKPLPPEELFATEKVDTASVDHAKELIEAIIPPTSPTEDTTVMADLKEAIQKNTNYRDQQAEYLANQEFIRKNYKTIYNLRKVFAFAKKAREMKERLDKQLLTIHDSGERRRAIKAMEKEVWASFEAEARRMTTSQGRLLLKLLARETGQTGYTIVKEYKGAIPAVFWQGVAVMFRQNLKSSYDSLGEDAVLEAIVKKYEKKEIK
ncbi:MAG: DUF4294 domain-containing protein [Bacteroidales bacterium]